MTPSLSGRLQTRLFLVLVVGTAWTIVVTPLLPAPFFLPLADRYEGTFQALVAVAILGLGWELLYHAIQQLRWEKDWPTSLGLLTGIPEGLLVRATVPDVPLETFVWHFATTWVVIFAFTYTGMRVLFPRWRFRGGRIV